MQWLTFFQKQFIMAPIQESYGLLSDGVTQGVQIYFPKYIENEGKEIIELAIPYLEEDGSLDMGKYLSVVDDWSSPETLTAKDLATARLIYESLTQKTDKWMAIPQWEADVHYTVGSTVVAGDGSNYSPNVYIALKDTIGDDPLTMRGVWSTVTEQERIITSWDLDGVEVSDDTIPSSKLVDQEFYLRAIRDWNSDIKYLVGSTVVYHGNVYISIRNENLGQPPLIESKGVSNLNDTYWSRISGDVDASEIPTSTEVFPLGSSVSQDDIHDEETHYSVVRLPEDTDSENHVFDIHHAFNTYSLFAQVKRGSGSRRYMDCTIETPERNILRVRISKATEEAVIKDLEVIVTPGGGRDEAYVMEDFVDKELFAAEKGTVIATLDEDGYITDSQLHIGSVDSSQDPTPDMLANVSDLRKVRKEAKDANDNLRSSLSIMGDLKTSKTEFGPWNPLANYQVGAVVSYDTGIYIATAPNNGVVPADDATIWKGAKFKDAEIFRYSVLFGVPGVSEYTLPHPLDTKDFVYAIRRVRDGRYMKEADIYAVDFGSVKVVIPEGIDAEPMVLNMYGCDRAESDLPSVGIQDITEESDTWLLDNPTRKPLFVQAFDSDGQLQYANVLQDPASSYDPVTIELYKSTTGSVVYAPASRVTSFSSADIVAVDGGYDLVIDKSQLRQAGDLENKWYLVQGYMGTEGQFMADFIQDGGSITIGLSEQYVDNLPEGWEASIILVEGNAIPISEQSRFEFILPSETTRPMGVQTYANGTGMVMGDAYCVDGKLIIDYGEPISGYVVIL